MEDGVGEVVGETENVDIDEGVLSDDVEEKTVGDVEGIDEVVGAEGEVLVVEYVVSDVVEVDTKGGVGVVVSSVVYNVVVGVGVVPDDGAINKK